MANDKSKSILSQWAKKKTKSASTTSEESLTTKKEFVASEGQQRLYFLDQLNSNQAVYNLTEVWTFEGAFDVDKMLGAFKEIGSRQDLLKARFRLLNDQIICQIQDTFDYLYSYNDLSSYSKETANDAFLAIANKVSNHNFDLENGPLVNINICSFNKTKHKIIINIHHIISDKWSMRNLRKELSIFYRHEKMGNKSPLPPLKAQFYHKVVDHIQTKTKSSTIKYWQEKLAGKLQKVSLPSDIKTLKTNRLKGQYAYHTLDNQMSVKVKTFCQKNKITPFIFFLSVFKTLIAHYCQTDDIILGTPISTRTKPEFEPIVGFFNDTIVLRNKIDLNKPFDQLLIEVKKTVFEAFEHKEIGFQQLISAVSPDRKSNGNPLFQMMFLFHKKNEEPPFSDNLTLTVENYDMGVSKFDFTLYVEESKDQFDIIIEYAIDLYTASFIDTFHLYYKTLIENVIENPNLDIGSINYLSAKDISSIKRLGTGLSNQVNAYPDIIQSIAKFNLSNKIALKDESQYISYAELHKKSNQIANTLRKDGITEGFVGVLMDQSIDFVVSMIGILKAGCAYLPLDISYPVEHINHAIKSANLACIICSSTSTYKSEIEIKKLYYDQVNESEAPLNNTIDPQSPAYLIFTSGSTGTPNGVVVSHENLMASTNARFDFYEEHPSSYLLLSSFSFDSSVAGIYWTLMNGGKLIIPKKSSIQDTELLTKLINDDRVSHTLLIPSLYQAYLESIPQSTLSNLQVIILAGETLTIPIAKKHFQLLPNVKLYNEYGPTESTVWITAHKVLPNFDVDTIPIGKPIGNNMVFVLNEQKNLTPVGIPGELYISGKSLTNGYLNQHGVAKDKFTQLTINDETYRAYRTGDWVTWNKEGDLLFLGRKDHQVKIRGYRIELGEIDAAIQDINENINPVTIYNVSQKLLITYIVSDKKINTDETLKKLSSKLPKQYWPDHVIQLESFPLMANGKVSIKELQQREIGVAKIKAPISIDTNENNPLLQIWREVMNDGSIGINDNFFEVGGDSIQLIRIIAKARKIGIKINAKDIYNNQTVSSLTSHVQPKGNKRPETFEWEYIPTTPIQDWFFDLHKLEPSHWLQGYEIKLKSPLLPDDAEKVVKKLIESNEIFNTYFEHLYGKWFIKKGNFTIKDFINHVDYSFDSYGKSSIKKGPLLQIYFVKENHSVSTLRLVIHHLIVDAISWQTIIHQLHDIIENPDIETQNQSMSFFKWAYKFNLIGQTKIFDRDIDFWESMLNKPSFYFSKTKNGLEKDVIEIKHRLLASTLNQLLPNLKEFSSIKINEAIIAAFLIAFHQASSEQALTLMVEGHGRNVDFIDADLSETLGWFTSYYPVHFELSDPTNILQSLIDVKDQLRRVPNQGISFGALTYCSKKISEKNNAKVTINHLGDLTEFSGNLFSNVDFIREKMRSPYSERTSLIEINTYTSKGDLMIYFTYDGLQLEKTKMEKLCLQFVDQLNGLPSILSNATPVSSVSDYDFEIEANDLQTIQQKNESKPSGIIALTATQSALLFHHLQSRKNDQGLITASVLLHGNVDQMLLQNAWNILIDQHDVLRSKFRWEGLDKPVQIIESKADSKIIFYDFSTKNNVELESLVEEITTEHTNRFTLNKTPIYQVICIKINSEKHRVIFICHHLFIDGWSTHLLFNDWVKNYDSISVKSKQTLRTLPSLNTWRKELKKAMNNGQLKSFWEDYTEHALPSILKPHNRAVKKVFKTKSFLFDKNETDNILAVVKQERITLTIFLVGIWSWLVSKYLEQETTSIGLILSGRSIELDHFDEMVGMFSTVLPFIQRQQKISTIEFQAIQDNFNEVLNRDAISIEDLIGIKKTQHLYDTLLIVENFIKDQDNKTSLTYSGFQSKISSLMPLCLIVVPDNQLRIKLRYNTDLYKEEEIDLIGNDLISTINGLTFDNKTARIAKNPTFTITRQPSFVPTSTEKPEVSIDLDMSTIEVVRHIWKNVLNIQNIENDDNFFELGGTSLMAVRIFNQINKQLKINASPILLLKHNTIASLMKVLMTPSINDSWNCLYSLIKKEGSSPLFCFHAGDGHILFYNDLAQHMNNRSVYGIQPVGLDGADIQFSSIKEMADYYLSKIKEKYPTGPYHLLGTCFSNAVTFEIAKQLGSEMGELIFVDSPPPYYKELSKMKKWLNWIIHFNIPKLWEAFNSLFKYSSWKEPIDEQERNLFLTGKHMRKIMAAYEWEPQPIDINLIRSSENNDDPFKHYHIKNWKQLASNEINIEVVNGKHQTIFADKSAEDMAKIIELLLSKHE